MEKKAAIVFICLLLLKVNWWHPWPGVPFLLILKSAKLYISYSENPVYVMNDNHSPVYHDIIRYEMIMPFLFVIWPASKSMLRKPWVGGFFMKRWLNFQNTLSRIQYVDKTTGQCISFCVASITKKVHTVLWFNTDLVHPNYLMKGWVAIHC